MRPRKREGRGAVRTRRERRAGLKRNVQRAVDDGKLHRREVAVDVVDRDGVAAVEGQWRVLRDRLRAGDRVDRIVRADDWNRVAELGAACAPCESRACGREASRRDTQSNVVEAGDIAPGEDRGAGRVRGDERASAAVGVSGDELPLARTGRICGRAEIEEQRVSGVRRRVQLAADRKNCAVPGGACQYGAVEKVVRACIDVVIVVLSDAERIFNAAHQVDAETAVVIGAIELDVVSGRGGTLDADPVAGVVVDRVGRRIPVVADPRIERAIADIDTVAAVTEVLGPGRVGSDLVVADDGAVGASPVDLDAVAGVAADGVVVDIGIVGTAVDEDAVLAVAERGRRVRVDANVVPTDVVVERAYPGHMDAVARVAGDHVAIGRVRAADRIEIRATGDQDTVQTVAERGHAGRVGTDVVAADRIVCRRGGRDQDALGRIAGDDVAGAGHGSADGVARAFDLDTLARVAERDATGDIDADVVAENDVVRAGVAADEHAVVLVAGDDVPLGGEGAAHRVVVRVDADGHAVAEGAGHRA